MKSTVNDLDRGEENKCSNIMSSTEEGGCSKKPLCNGDRQRKKLLYLQGIWAHGPTLQEQGGRIRIGNSRRLKYGQRWGREENFEQLDNLKEEENLESLNQILTIGFMY